jgi:hypothetical protein
MKGGVIRESLCFSPFEKGGLRGILKRKDKSSPTLLFKRREKENFPLAKRETSFFLPLCKRGIEGDFKKKCKILPCPPLRKEGVEKKAGDFKTKRS